MHAQDPTKGSPAVVGEALHRKQPKFFWTATLKNGKAATRLEVVAPSLPMMHSLIRPNAWVALKLPSGSTKVLQIAPNT